jgi:putative nucleotidyltransferase with HDIG domain
MVRSPIPVSRSKIENISALPTVPGSLKRISSIIEKPSVSLDQIGQFISNDPALTTKILKMVNSAAYGFPGRISSISHATMLLGLNVVKGLLLGVSVFELMEKMMSGLWAHSLGCAIAAREIANKLDIKDPEEISVAALLHDIGKVIMIMEFHKEYEETIKEASVAECLIYDAEKMFFTETHPTVGMWLAKKWSFPLNLVEVIAYHHTPQMSKLAAKETAIVNLADILVRARGIGFAGDNFVPPLSPAAFETLGLSNSDIRDILTRIEETHQVSDDMMAS